MKCLTIHQPWASAIVAGIKGVENRWWRTGFRGLLAIHAGKSLDTIKELRIAAEGGGDAEVGLEALRPLEPFESLPVGKLLGVVEVTACCRYTMAPDLDDDPFATGPWCWILEAPRRCVTPKIWRGERGLFEIPFEYVDPDEWRRI